MTEPLMSSAAPGTKMEETASSSNLRQPKKRFVGRRTADAQAQKDASSSSKDVESTSIQRGEGPVFCFYDSHFQT
jgi:2-(3-amino-3-carboxypropyl)histidine synthase